MKKFMVNTSEKKAPNSTKTKKENQNGTENTYAYLHYHVQNVPMTY